MSSKTPVWQNHGLYLDFPVSKVGKVIFGKCQNLVYFDRGLDLSYCAELISDKVEIRLSTGAGNDEILDETPFSFGHRGVF